MIADYPDAPEVPAALFHKGLVYEQDLGELEEAREIYRDLITGYPGTSAAKMAEKHL